MSDYNLDYELNKIIYGDPMDSLLDEDSIKRNSWNESDVKLHNMLRHGSPYSNDREPNIRKMIDKKYKPYSFENTVYYLGYSRIGDEYKFVKIARTLPLWGKEVKVIINGRLSEFSFPIDTDSVVCVPYTEESLEKLRDYYKGKKVNKYIVSDAGTCTLRHNWIFVDLIFDIIRFDSKELKYIQDNEKSVILRTEGINTYGYMYLRKYYNSGTKHKISSDVLYSSLFEISKKNNNRGVLVKWKSDILKDVIGTSEIDAVLKPIQITDIEKYNWKEKGFDMFSFELSTKNGNNYILSRKEVSSLYRRKQLIIV